jgi:hypothetical protein
MKHDAMLGGVGAYALAGILLGVAGSVQAGPVEPCGSAPEGVAPGTTATERGWLGAQGAPLPFECEEDVLDFLRTAQVVEIKTLPVGSTRPKKLLLRREGVEAHAVFRYVEVEKKRHRLNDGTFHLVLRDSYRHGLAAYELSRLLGLDTIPPIVARTIEGQRGSVQLWIENAMTEGSRREKKRLPPDLQQHAKEMWKMEIFDALICNIDRNVGNILLDPTWKVWYIDHTRAFAVFEDRPLPDPVLGIDAALLEKLQQVRDETIRERLAPHIGTYQIDDLLERRQRLVTGFAERRRAQEAQDAGATRLSLADGRPPGD